MHQPPVLFHRTVRVCNGETIEQEIFLSLCTRHLGVLDPSIAYKLPGFPDAAQVRGIVANVERGGGEVQLKVFKTTAEALPQLLVVLRQRGWRVVAGTHDESDQ